ncbi:MAG TPA: alpha/beta hydrolase [Gaiellaceae bacterium]|nr:alpha/beta hydrolase [Gaiellaceae bacterium]
MGGLPPAPVVRYGDDPEQLVNLHLPAASPPMGVVALVHGGFWRARWDRTLMTPLAVDLARRGYAAWNVEFRRVGQPGGGWPGTVLDVRAALDALASQPELAGRRVVLVGHSSGGHLALAAARGRSDVAAVVALAALTDLEQARELDAEAVDAFLGGPPERAPAVHAEASPRASLPLGVRQLLVHGEQDDVVPARMSAAYAEAARAAGDVVELELLPRADHFDVIDPAHAAWSLAAAWIERALGASACRARGRS